MSSLSLEKWPRPNCNNRFRLTLRPPKRPLTKSRLVSSTPRKTTKGCKNLHSTGGGVSRREIDEAFSTFRSQAQLLIGAETLFKKLTTTREAKLSQARLAVQAQDAEIRQLQEQRQEFTIRAPFAGFVTVKMTELGQWLNRGDRGHGNCPIGSDRSDRSRSTDFYPATASLDRSESLSRSKIDRSMFPLNR